MDRPAESLTHIQGADMSELPEAWQFSWQRIYKQGEGVGKAIPFQLALESVAIINDIPTIERDEIHYRKQLLHDLA